MSCGHPVETQIDIAGGVGRVILLARCDVCAHQSAQALASVRRWEFQMSRDRTISVVPIYDFLNRTRH